MVVLAFLKPYVGADCRQVHHSAPHKHEDIMWLFALFVAVPIIEIALFIQVGGAIGLGWTLLIVVLTAILGTWLVRAQGLHVMSQVRGSFSELRDPTEPLAHGAMILFSGALLLTPGFFTDAVGFSLLVPGIRSFVFNYLRSKIKMQGFSVNANAKQRQRSDPRGTVIDGEYEEVTDEVPDAEMPTRGNSGWTRH